MIKPWINFAFLYQPERIEFLETALKELKTWSVEKMRILISVNDIEDNIALKLQKRLLEANNNVVIKLVNVGNQDPRILQWEHKNYLREFLDSEYTHFIYADADLVIPKEVINYWVKTKSFFEQYGFLRFIPGTFRYENYNNLNWTIDTTYRTDLNNMVYVNIHNQMFYSPQEPFQGISIMNKEMATEHLNSPYISMDSIGVYGFGFGETAISGYIFHDPPKGFTHRILIPLNHYQDCWVLHLPNNYAANPHKEHGKIHAHTMFSNIKERQPNADSLNSYLES